MTGEKKTGDIRPTTNYRAIFKNVGYKNYIAANYRVRVKKKKHIHKQKKKRQVCRKSKHKEKHIKTYFYYLY